MTAKQLIIIAGANGSGKTTFAIPYVKELGFNVKIIYIFLDDAALCVRRVKIRVLKGGHDVPVDDIVRRFYRSKNNFWENFTRLADKWELFYNGEAGFQQVAIGVKQEFSVENGLLFTKFQKIKS